MRPLAHAVIVAALSGSAPTSGHAAEPPPAAPATPATATPPARSTAWQLSKHIGQPAPSPADLGLTWIKGVAVKEWSKDRPTVLVYEPPIKASINWFKFPQPRQWQYQLVKLTGTKAAFVAVIADEGLHFSHVDSPLDTCPIARADWQLAGPRLTDSDLEWYSHIMVIDTRGRVAWVGALETDGAAYVVEQVARGVFDASAHMDLLTRAVDLDKQLHAAIFAPDEAAADKTTEQILAICPWRRAELRALRVQLLLRLRRLDEALGLAESLIRGDCAGNFDSLQDLDRYVFEALGLVVERHESTDRLKSLRAQCMAAAADALDQADASTDAEAAKRYAEMENWNEAVRWQSLALSYASESQRDDYQKKLQSYIDRLEGRTPPEDINPMFHK